MELWEFNNKKFFSREGFFKEISNFCEILLNDFNKLRAQTIEDCAKSLKSVVSDVKNKTIGPLVCLVLYKLGNYYYKVENYKKSLSFVDLATNFFEFIETCLKNKILLLKSKILAKTQKFNYATEIIKELFEPNKNKSSNQLIRTSFGFVKNKKNSFVLSEKYELLENFEKAYNSYLSIYKNDKKNRLKGQNEKNDSKKFFTQKNFKTTSRFSFTKRLSDDNFFEGTQPSLSKYFPEVDGHTIKNFKKNKLSNYFPVFNEKNSVVTKKTKKIKLNHKFKANYRSNSMNHAIFIISPSSTPENLKNIGIKADLEARIGKISHKKYDFSDKKTTEKSISLQIQDISAIKEEKNIFNNNIAQIIKIQALIRKIFCKERFFLIKNKKNIIKHAVKRIRAHVFHIRILRENNKLIVNCDDGTQNNKILIPDDIEIDNIVLGLRLNE